MPDIPDITPDDAIALSQSIASDLSLPGHAANFMAGMLLIIRDIVASDCQCDSCARFRETINTAGISL